MIPIFHRSSTASANLVPTYATVPFHYPVIVRMKSMLFAPTAWRLFLCESGLILLAGISNSLELCSRNRAVAAPPLQQRRHQGTHAIGASIPSMIFIPYSMAGYSIKKA